MITLEQVSTIKQGDILMLVRDGWLKPRRYKVTSVHRWKRTPDRFEIRVKHGLYEYDRITNADKGTLTISNDK